MRRREFLWLVGFGVAASTPLPVGAQQARKTYRIAIVSNASPVTEMSETASVRYRPFFRRLRELGYIEGQNLVVERYSGGGQLERYRELVGEVVRSSPDVVFTSTANLLVDFKAQTTTIPIVGVIYDPVALGLVESMAHPGGNITGSAVPVIAVWGKRLGLLKEAIPKLSRVGLLVAPTLMGQRGTVILKEASEKAGISLVGSPLDSPFDETAYRRTFATLVQDGAEAVYVGEQSENAANRRVIVELAEKHGLPAIYPDRGFVEIGGLMAYEADLADEYGHAADAVVEILKGTKAGDIPFYLVRKFDFIINLKTAKALGIEIPNSILAQADEVIE
jgi:putative ABC transport system substrate-binding protein